MTRYVTEQVVSERIAVRGGDMLVQAAAYDDVSLRTLAADGRSKLIFFRFLLARPALEDNFGPLPSTVHSGGNNVLLLLRWPSLILRLLHGWHIRRCHWLRIEHAQRRRMCMAAPMADVGAVRAQLSASKSAATLPDSDPTTRQVVVVRV